MADTNHAADLPVEGDGVSYRGIGWFLAVLVGTVLFCEVLVWALFGFAERYRVPDDARAPLAAPVTEPRIENGRVLRGGEEAPGPGLLTQEPVVLKAFRDEEERLLHTYGWVDQSVGTVRLTIDRAKELLIERGLPAREGRAPADSTSAPETLDELPAAPMAAPAEGH